MTINPASYLLLSEEQLMVTRIFEKFASEHSAPEFYWEVDYIPVERHTLDDFADEHPDAVFFEVLWFYTTDGVFSEELFRVLEHERAEGSPRFMGATMTDGLLYELVEVVFSDVEVDGSLTGIGFELVLTD